MKIIDYLREAERANVVQLDPLIKGVCTVTLHENYRFMMIEQGSFSEFIKNEHSFAPRQFYELIRYLRCMKVEKFSNNQGVRLPRSFDCNVEDVQKYVV